MHQIPELFLTLMTWFTYLLQNEVTKWSYALVAWDPSMITRLSMIFWQIRGVTCLPFPHMLILIQLLRGIIPQVLWQYSCLCFKVKLITGNMSVRLSVPAGIANSVHACKYICKKSAQHYPRGHLNMDQHDIGWFYDTQVSMCHKPTNNV